MAPVDLFQHCKTVGIIAEYNPFHNGHAYQIREVRKQSGADYIIIVMSGDFVQRGRPALLDKYARARLALLGGADLVLELPCAAASGSAARFAQEAVRILDRLGVVQELWFGSEAGELAPLLEAAAVLAEEPPHFRNALRQSLRQGNSYPLARQKALEACSADGEKLAAPELLCLPNNILGIEYCTALKRLRSSVLPRTLKRVGSGYHDRQASGSFASASALRLAVKTGNPEEAERQMPPEVFSAFSRLLSREGWLELNDFSLLLKCLLLDSREEDLLPCMPWETARRVLSLRNHFLSFSQFAELIKTRGRTRSSIDRDLLHFLLGIPSASGLSPGSAFSGSLACRTITDDGFARVLGFRRRSSPLLASIKQAEGLRLEARPSRLPREAYALDLRTSNLYEAVRSQKMGQSFREECTRQPVIL